MLLANTQTIWPEQRLIGVLQGNVAVAIPLLLLILKLAILRTVGDPDEFFRRLVSIPLELIFISDGIIVAGLARRIPFASHYASDTQADFSGAMILIVLAGLAAVIYRADRYVHVVLQKFFTAIQSTNLQVNQPGFEFTNAPLRVSWKLTLGLGYFLFALLIWVFEMIVGIVILWPVFLRVQ
jgi:hypothetical protein